MRISVPSAGVGLEKREDYIGLFWEICVNPTQLMAVLLCIVARGVNLRHGHEKLRSGIPRESRDWWIVDSPPARRGSARRGPMRTGPGRLFVVSCGLSFISASMRLRRPAAQRPTSPNGRRVTSTRTSLVAVGQSISEQTSCRMPDSISEPDRPSKISAS